MKRLVLFIFLIASMKSYAIEDSCLYMERVDCPQFGYFNSDSVMNDRCGWDQSFYVREYFELIIDQIVFNLKKYPSDTLLKFDYKEIDSMLSLNSKFFVLRKDFQTVFEEFGNFYLTKKFPDIIDSNHLASHTYLLGFEHYQNLDSITNLFKNFSNIPFIGFTSLPYSIPEAFGFSKEEMRYLNYPEFELSVSVGNDWVQGLWNFVIFRKLNIDSEYKPIDLSFYKSMYIKKNQIERMFYYFKDSLLQQNFSNISYKVCVTGTTGICERLCNSFSINYTDVEVSKSENNAITLSPNPAFDFIEITKPSEGFEPSEGSANTVRIFNVFGEIVLKSSDLNNSQFSIHNSQFRIDVSGLPSGIYFVRVGDKVVKFVKI